VPKLLLNSFGFEFRCGLVVPPDKVRMGFRASGMIFMRMFPRNLVRMTGIGMLVLVLRRWIGDAVVLVVAEFVRLVLMSLMIGGMPLLHRRLRVPPREVRTSLLVALVLVRRLRHETVLGAPASLRPLNDALPVPGLRALQQMHRIGSLHALGVLAWGGGGEG